MLRTPRTIGGGKAFSFLLLLLASVGITVAGGGQKSPSPNLEQAGSLLRPGLQLEIQKVAVNAPNVTVTFRISDEQGQGLDRLGVLTPGQVTVRFVLARIKPGDKQYSSYVMRPKTGSVTGMTKTLPMIEADGTFTSVGDGVYQYVMATTLPSTYEANATHTLGVTAVRDVTAFARELGLTTLAKTGKYVANATYDFVPAGGPVTQVRQVVSTEACNQCHDPIGAHGGTRNDTRLCVLCHQPQNSDLSNANVSLDFKVYIHKLHMGVNLPSVTGKSLSVFGTSGANAVAPATGQTQNPMPPGFVPAGKRYTITTDDVLDASTIVFPQDVRNCTTCHQKGAQSDNWKSNPSRAACGSCHDDVKFDTGENHMGGVQVDDSQCNVCHPADSGLEFDLSVAGVHTILPKSTQMPGLKVQITGVTGTNAGDKPAVSFTVTDNKGNPLDASKLDRLRFTIAGPTSDYTTDPPWQEDAPAAVTGDPSGYTYAFKAALPAKASGTWAIGAEAFRLVSIPGALLGQSFSVRDSAFNPVFYFGIGGSQVVPRRKVVDVNNCNQCHKSLALHGAVRRNTEYCVMCHNPKHGDSQTPPETVNFRTFIHRVHMGEKLDSPFTAGGVNFNGLRFPGDQRNCSKCHVGSTYTLPVPDGLATTDAFRFFYTPLQPTASACLGCHNGVDAAAHAYLNTTSFGEACAVCHEEGAEFAVTKVHAR